MKTEVRETQPENASFPIPVTDSGISTNLRKRQSLNALSPMDFTFCPRMTDGMTTCAERPLYFVRLVPYISKSDSFVTGRGSSALFLISDNDAADPAVSSRFAEMRKREIPINSKTKKPASRNHLRFFNASTAGRMAPRADSLEDSSQRDHEDDLEGFFPVRASTNSTHDAKRFFRFFESARSTTLLTSAETFVSGGAGMLTI